jgi:predicted dehydrogenase
MSEKKTLNVALIGHKFMGKAHTHGYTAVKVFFEPRLTPVKYVICARSGDLPGIADRWGWKSHTADWREVVNDPAVDMVDISAPSKIHREIVLAAARAGKHIFCEKPLAMNLADAREMLAAVEEAGIRHTIGFNYRKVPALALARQLVEKGLIGEVYHFRGIYSQDWLTNPDFPLAWRLRKEDAGAGASWDLGAHVIDQARFLVGEVEEVIGMQSTFIKERPVAAKEDGLVAVAGSEKGTVDVDDASSALMRFANGAHGIVEVSRNATGHRNQNRIELNGSEGAVIFDMERMNELQFYSRKDPDFAQGYRTIQVGEGDHPYVGNWWPAGHIIGFGDTFVHEVYDFIEAIADEKPASPTFEDGLKCQEILTAIDQSVAERRWVKISEFQS